MRVECMFVAHIGVQKLFNRFCESFKSFSETSRTYFREWFEPRSIYIHRRQIVNLSRISSQTEVVHRRKFSR